MPARDLASLRPGQSADDERGGWRLEGQKVWTSYAQFADLGLCLARTDPDARKHHGISALVVDMSDPRRRGPAAACSPPARPSSTRSSSTAPSCPTTHLVGPLHEGWRVSQSTLGHERGVNPRQLVIHIQHLEELLRLAVATGALDQHRLRQQLAEAFVEVKLFQLHNWRSLSRLERGEAPGPEGSTLKLYWSEMSKRLHATAMDVLGDDAAPLWRGAGTGRATANGSARGSTTCRRRCSPGPTRSSATSSGSACWTCPGSHDERRDHRHHRMANGTVDYALDGPVATVTMAPAGGRPTPSTRR